MNISPLFMTMSTSTTKPKTKSRKKKVIVDHETVYNFLGSRNCKIGKDADFDLYDIEVKEIGIDRRKINEKK